MNTNLLLHCVSSQSTNAYLSKTLTQNLGTSKVASLTLDPQDDLMPFSSTPVNPLPGIELTSVLFVMELKMMTTLGNPILMTGPK